MHACSSATLKSEMPANNEQMVVRDNLADPRWGTAPAGIEKKFYPLAASLRRAPQLLFPFCFSNAFRGQ